MPMNRFHHARIPLIALAVIALNPLQLCAANFVLNATDAAGTTSFNSGLHWPGGAAPAPGNTYQTANFLLRTPANATAITFQGDSLEVQTGGTLRDKTAAVVTITNLILAQGAIVELTQPNGVNTAAAAGTLAGNITLNGTATFHAGISTDVAGETFTVSSTISGAGGITTSGSNGKVVLTGTNTYSGDTTVAGLANSTLRLGSENAVSNSTVVISLANGLAFSSGITSFNLGGLAGASNTTLTNLGGAAVTLVVGGNNAGTTYAGILSGAGGLTKVGTGTLTLNNANNYAGITTVNAGKLAVSSAQATTNEISVGNGATLGVTVSGTNQLQPALLTFNAGATNEFLSVSSSTIAPLKSGTLTLNGASTINIVSGNFVAGTSYPLIEYTTPTGAGSIALGVLPPGVSGNLSTIGNTIYLNVTGVAATIWTGAINNSWDIGATANWTVSGVGSTYLEGVTVIFPEGGANPNVNLLATVSPASTTVSNSSTAYSLNGSPISGIGGLTKLGAGVLTLNNTNSYAGNTVISNGTILLGTDNAFPGGAGKGGVTVASTLDLNTRNQLINSLSGSGVVDSVAGGAPTLTVGGGDASGTFAGQIKNSAGTLALTKIGTGTQSLTGSNSYSGATTVAGGTLVIGANNANGSTPFVLTNVGSALRFATNVNYRSAFGLTISALNESETITVDSGADVTLAGLDGGNPGNASIWLGGGGTLRLTNAATTFAGLLRINNATMIIENNAAVTDVNNNLGLQIGSGVVPGAPTNSTGTLTVRGNGQLTMSLQGIRVGSDGVGATGILNVQDAAVVTTPLIYLPRQGNNTGIVNQASGIVNLSSLQGAHSAVPTNWLGVYNLNGGTLAWNGVFGGAPVDPSERMYFNFNGGLLQFTGSGNIGGWTALNVLSNGARIDIGGNSIALSDALVAGDAFGGGLNLTGAGGYLTLMGTNTYTGNTVISNATLALMVSGVTGLSNSPVLRVESGGTLDVNSVGGGFHVVSGQTLRGNGTVSGAVRVDVGGTLTVGGSTGTPGILTFNNNLTLNGNTVLRLDKSAASDQLIGIATLQAGGTLTLTNLGPALANGDSFTLFAASSISGGFVISPITPGPGLAWDQSQLSSGIIKVGIAPASPIISPQLQNQTVECSANTTFTAVATGTEPLYFRWSSNSIPVTGWTTNNPNVLTFTNIKASGSPYTISVQVTNAVGTDSSSATLTVQDTSAPVVTLNGSNVMNIIIGSPFVDPGATATDACEGTLSVTTNGTVDVNAAGSYLITYTATDSQNLSASVNRTVNVIFATRAWTNLASGVWSASANWLNGGVANGNDTLADFSTIDLTNDVTVSLDSARTIAGLAFGDTASATAAGWTLDNNGNAANVLTLQRLGSGMPEVSVGALGTGKSVTISAGLGGTSGLSKLGAGTLVLSGSNTYTGTTVVANGALVISGSFTNVQSDFALTNSNSTLRFASNANYTLVQGISFSDNPSNANETLSIELGAEVLAHGLNGGNSGASEMWFSGGGTLHLTNSVSTYSGRLRINNLTFIIDNGAVFNNDNPGLFSQVGSGAVPNTPANSTGVMTVRGNGQYIQSQQGLRIGSDANGATGILNVQDSAVVTTPLIYLPRQSGNTGIVNQAGGTVTVTTIQGGGGGTWSGTYNLNGGTLAWGGVFGTGPTAVGQSMNLNLNGGVLQFTASTTVVGWSAIGVKANHARIDTMANTVTFTDPLVAGDAASGGLTKLGSGTLILSGANTYVGPTRVHEGTLELSQPTLSPTALVTVSNSAVLQLDFATTNTIGGLVLNGVTQLPGVYDSVTGAPFITGTGSLLVPSSIATNPTNITFSVSGSTLSLSWPSTHLGWILQTQTNSASVGLATNWVDVPGSSTITATNMTINPAPPVRFFRLRSP